MGIRFKLINRFGLFSFKKFRFPSYGNRSVCERTKNRRIRFRFVRLGFRFNRTNPSIWSAGRRRCKSCSPSRLGVASLPAAAPWPVLGAARPTPRPLLAGRRCSSCGRHRCSLLAARRRCLVDSPLPARLQADLLRSSLISLEVTPVPLLAPAAMVVAVPLLSLLAAPLASSGAHSRHSLASA